MFAEGTDRGAVDRDDLAPTLLVAGTASHVGKSTVAAGLCRLLADRGVDVVPFKAQNMSNNARAVPKAVGDGIGVQQANGGGERRSSGSNAGEASGPGIAFGEIGVSQYVQARAARVRPTTDLNPVLLKPRGNAESQLVVDGEAIAHYDADEYYDRYWEVAREAAERAWRRLAREHEVVVAEGAGSIAEINLHDRDLANLELARFADATVLLVADIERGGVFASLVGTLELLPPDVRKRVAGAVVNKFRGDRSILAPGIEAFEERTGVPVLGVLPHDDPGLPEEDSLALPEVGERAVRGRDGVPDAESVTVAVPRLPRIANFTDLEPLAAEPGVRVSYRPLAADLADADAVVLPGSKNTVDDLLALREAGLDRKLRAFDGPIVGLCAGYQLLGERITNADVEGTGSRETVGGVGLLPVETRFEPEKHVEATSLHVDGIGPLTGATGTVTGYEIHQGRTRAIGRVETPFAPSADEPGDARLGAAVGDVLGTYLHGLFENQAPRLAFVERAFAAAGIDPPTAAEEPVGSVGPSANTDRPRSPYDRAARLCAEHVDVGTLFDRSGSAAAGVRTVGS